MTSLVGARKAVHAGGSPFAVAFPWSPPSGANTRVGFVAEIAGSRSVVEAVVQWFCASPTASMAEARVNLVPRAVTWLQRAFLAAVAGWHVGSGSEPFAVGSVSGGRRRGFCISQAPRTPRCQTSHLGDSPEAPGFPHLSTEKGCLPSV
ncbi:hypothetical protein CMEL01_10730 [Colletotrichum melonis]|uniref:Uncharacterized protein n=1 Tax=Colletotrichum melonis TaxID=1209925 RepID=A0AAI9V114_9PEZI|nr:hypothetical protein CMEL01_10730 [Colletotrichum melonis]